MKIKNTLFLLMGIFCPLLVQGQVAIGTNKPHDSAELSLESSTRGFLMPRIALESLQDTKSIAAGNIESLILYNITTNQELTPGYYYWAQARWNRIAQVQDIPLIVLQTLEDRFSKEILQDMILELINQSSGSVWYIDNVLYYKDQDNSLSQIKLEHAHSILSFDPASGILTYLDSSQNTTRVNLKEVVENFQGTSRFEVDYVEGFLNYYNQRNELVSVDVNKMVKEQNNTTYLHKLANGVYQYTNELEDQTTIELISDLTNALQDLSEEHFQQALKQKIQQDQSKVAIDASTSSNIDIVVSKEQDKDVYSLRVPFANNTLAGVVLPGNGLQIDEQGRLSIADSFNVSPQDLIGSPSIVVTSGDGAVLKQTSIDIVPGNIKLKELFGELSFSQIPSGEKGQVLSTDHKGEVQWLEPSLSLSNELGLNNTILSSTVQGITSSVDFQNSISTPMLKDLGVTRFKLNKDVAGPGLIKNPTTGALEVDFAILPEKFSSGNISTKTLNILGEPGALLKDLEINIRHGQPNQVLVTNSFGSGVEWSDASEVYLGFTNEIAIIDNLLVTKVNNVEGIINLTQQITNSMLEEKSISTDKLRDDFLGEGLKIDSESKRLEIDYSKLGQNFGVQEINSVSLEVAKADNSGGNDIVLEIKPGKAHQVLVTSADETKVEWVNANTLICKDTFQGPLSQQEQQDTAVLASGVTKSVSRIYLPNIELPYRDTTQVLQYDLYDLFTSSFSSAHLQSNPDSSLAVAGLQDLDFFITSVDPEVFELLSLSDKGVLRYVCKANAHTTKASTIHLVIDVK